MFVTYETHVATDDLSISIDASNIITYHSYITTFDHFNHMLLQMAYLVLQMSQMLQHPSLATPFLSNV